jgi:hypothetical protein
MTSRRIGSGDLSQRISVKTGDDRKTVSGTDFGAD